MECLKEGVSYLLSSIKQKYNKAGHMEILHSLFIKYSLIIYMPVAILGRHWGYVREQKRCNSLTSRAHFLVKETESKQQK